MSRPTLQARLQRILGLPSVERPPLAVPDDEAFASYARALTVQNLTLAGLLLFAGSAVSWAFDPLVYCRAPALAVQFAPMRAFHTASMAAFYLALRFTPAARRANALALVVVGLSCVFLGWTAGTLGDLTAPWVHFAYAGAIGILVPVVTLRLRALYGFVYAAGLAAGFVLARPSLPPPPMLIPTVTFLLLVTVAAVAAGHAIFRLVRQGEELEPHLRVPSEDNGANQSDFVTKGAFVGCRRSLDKAVFIIATCT